MPRTQCPIFFAFTTKGACVPVYCGKWTCERCAKHNARLWAWRAKLEIESAEGIDYYFITLTLPARFRTAEEGYRELPRIWDRIRKWVTRAIGGPDWAYLAFVEGQPKRVGMPHFHIISNWSIAYLATKKAAHGRRRRYGKRYKVRIKDWSVSRGMGFQAVESRITGPMAASYVAKYATKQDQRMPKGFRRVRASKMWHKLPEWQGDSLLVKSKTETLAQYLDRVSEITDLSIDELYERWEAASDASHNSAH